MSRVPACVVALSLGLASLAYSQTPAPPSAPTGIARPGSPGGPGGARPGGPSPNAFPQTGTSIIRGRVVAAQSGAPLRRAQVFVFAPDTGLRRMVTTDAKGQYEVKELPAGRYSINASKAGYVSLQYGQRRPYEAGTPVAVADGETLARIDLMLPRGSVIIGRITDEFGEPIAQAQVQALRYQYGPDGQRRLAPAMMQATDDLGQFRLFGLMPGEYVVNATVRNLAMNFGIAPNTNDAAEGYPPTFYPGSVNPADAETISLAVGEETSIQLALQPARMSQVSGTVVDSQGRPVSGAMLMLRAGSNMSMTMAGVGQTAADGTFTLTNVAPGEYSIDVRPQGAAGAGEFASAPVTVTRSDISGLRIATEKGATISGRVVFEGTSPRTGGTTPLRVLPSPVDPSRIMMFAGNDPLANGAVGDDGTFKLSGVSGEIFFRALTPPAWTLKSVTLEGEDITDVAFDATGKESVSGLRIVLTDKLTQISGQVLDARGQPAHDYVVVFVPAKVVDGVSSARFLRLVRPDQDGQFRTRGLPPGNYIAAAVESMEQGRQFVPEVQARLRSSGRAFSVREGATVSLDLKLIAGF